MGKTKLELFTEAAADVGDGVQPDETLTDIQPPGAGMVRTLGAADLRIASLVSDAIPDLSEWDSMMISLYTITHPIRDVWELARAPLKLRAVAEAWSFDLPATEMETIRVELEAAYKEYNALAGLHGDDNTDDGAKKKTG